MNIAPVVPVDAEDVALLLPLKVASAEQEEFVYPAYPACLAHQLPLLLVVASGLFAR